MPAKKRSRSNPKAEETSTTESDAAHVTPTPTTTKVKGNIHDSTPALTGARGDKNKNNKKNTAKSQSGTNAREKLSSDLEGVVLRSAVIAPDVVGIRCIAVHPSEREMVVVRENGSIVLYGVESFQNVPHFERIRHTGGRVNRTITRVRYLHTCRPLFLASYMSGQLVVYCGETLSPLHVHQRTGGAVWDFCILGACVYTAMADGSWQQLQIEDTRAGTPTLTLQRIIPKVSGADRALSVCSSELCGGVAAGTDDAGNVLAWRLPREEGRNSDDSTTTTTTHNNNNNLMGGRPMSLSDHEPLWTSRLPKGMGLCCTLAGGVKGGGSPVVAVGTSMGDLVLFDAMHGHVLKTFTHHKGPLCTVVSSGDVLYASGWHESLRSYRCNAENEWFPAEVKRRTHYHEASELLLLKNQQLILSAARDGTVMYSPIDSVFTSPAMYVSVTTQQFAFAKAKNILLQTRHGRIEGFRTDATLRHWMPLFAYKVHGKFHIQGLWCDDQLYYILFATDERAALLRLCWRDGFEDALSLSRIEEVAALPVGRGVLDCCFVHHNNNNNNSANDNNNEDEEEGATTKCESCYVLLDDAVLHITLSEGYPVVSTAMNTLETEGVGDIRPNRLLLHAENNENNNNNNNNMMMMTVCGLRGRLTCFTAADGTIDPSSFVWSRESTRMAAAVPALRQHTSPTVVALTDNSRYVAGINSSSCVPLPRTLPHDVRFVARLPPPKEKAAAGAKSDALHFLAVFSRGLLHVTEGAWHMLQRCAVEAAFVLRGDERVLLLVRNLEGTLEALPMCWKVRRFGN